MKGLIHTRRCVLVEIYCTNAKRGVGIVILEIGAIWASPCLEETDFVGRAGLTR